MQRRVLPKQEPKSVPAARPNPPIFKPEKVKSVPQLNLHRVELDGNFHAETRRSYYIGNVHVAFAYENKKEGVVLRVITPYLYKMEKCADWGDLEDRLLTELMKPAPQS